MKKQEVEVNFDTVLTSPLYNRQINVPVFSSQIKNSTEYENWFMNLFFIHIYFSAQYSVVEQGLLSLCLF